MLELDPAVDDRLFLEEAIPARAPVGKGCKPCRRFVQVAYMQKILRDAVEIRPRLEFRFCRGLALDLLKRMEGAPLHAGCGPNCTACLLEAVASIGYHDIGGSDTRHEGCPRFSPGASLYRSPACRR